VRRTCEICGCGSEHWLYDSESVDDSLWFRCRCGELIKIEAPKLEEIHEKVNGNTVAGH
jgi:hypothetical protein